MIGHYQERLRTDIDVDFLCVGSGFGTLAAAITPSQRARCLGVFVAHHDEKDSHEGSMCQPSWTDRLCWR